MTAFAKVALGLVAFLMLTIAALAWKLTAAQHALTVAQLVPTHQAAVSAAARVDTVKIQLQGATQLVTRTIRRTRTDTLLLRPTTAAETVTVVKEVPVLVASLDTLTRACSALVLSCQQYRVGAEARFRADSLEKDALREALRAEQPGRLAAIWGYVKMPLAFAGGVAIGARVTH